MEITFYTTSDDKRKLTKNLTNVKTVQCTVKQQITLTNPVVYLHYDSNLINANYAFIPEFNRYYFIDNMNLIDGNMIQIAMSVDVLMSYNAEIKNLTAIVDRGNSRNLTINDKTFIPTAYTNTIVYPFSETFSPSTQYKYVMQVAGGGAL